MYLYPPVQCLFLWRSEIFPDVNSDKQHDPCRSWTSLEELPNLALHCFQGALLPSQAANHPPLYCFKKPTHLQCELQNYGNSRRSRFSQVPERRDCNRKAKFPTSAKTFGLGGQD